MKKLLKQSISVLAATTLCVSMIMGCSTGKEKPEKEETKEKTSSDISGELNIAVFQGGIGDTYWYDMIEKFEKKYPDVTVNMNINPKIGEIIKPQIVAGNVPDFISLNMAESSGVVASLVKENALMELTDIFEEPLEGDSAPLKDKFLDGVIGSNLTCPYGDDKIYLAPFDSGPMGLVYNKTLFEEKGWEVPVTWDDFFALGELAKEDTFQVGDKEEKGRALLTYPGIYPQYMRNFLFVALAQNGGTDAVNKFSKYEDGSALNEPTKTYLEKIPELVEKGYLLEGNAALNHTQSQGEMLLGKALFIPSGVWMVNEMVDAPREKGFEYGMCPVPTMKEGDPKFIAASNEQFSIPAKAKNPDAAKAFLKFLYSEESIKSLAENSGVLYATKDAAELCEGILEDDILNMYKEAYADSKSVFCVTDPIPQGCNIDVNQEMYHKYFTKMVEGTMTVEEYLKNIENAWSEVRGFQAE